MPDEAIGSDQDRRIVYVVGDNNSDDSLGPSASGRAIDGYRVIREGLKGDETIVVNGLVRVRPGRPVSPQMTMPASPFGNVSGT